MEDLSLEKIEAVLVAIEQAATVQEIKGVIDAGIGYAVYAKQAKLGKESEEKIKDYISLAERKLGEMLQAAKAAGRITHNHDDKRHPNHVVPNKNNVKTTLEKEGIDRKLSSRAQRLARMPKEEFNQMLADRKKPREKSGKKEKPVQLHPQTEEIIILHDQGIGPNDIAAQLGINQTTVSRAIAKEKSRREGKQAAKQEMTAEAALETLSMSAKEKLVMALRQQTKKQEQEYEARVQARVNDLVKHRLEMISKQWSEEQERVKRIMKNRYKFMTRAEYRKVLACLHPDWVTDPKQKLRYEDAFRIFKELEKCVLDEKDSPTTYMPIPRTEADWAELKRQADERRKARRQQRDGDGALKT
jgi:hypothetical protein